MRMVQCYLRESRKRNLDLAIKELELKIQMKLLINKYEQIMKWKKILRGINEPRF